MYGWGPGRFACSCMCLDVHSCVVCCACAWRVMAAWCVVRVRGMSCVRGLSWVCVVCHACCWSGTGLDWRPPFSPGENGIRAERVIPRFIHRLLWQCVCLLRRRCRLSVLGVVLGCWDRSGGFVALAGTQRPLRGSWCGCRDWLCRCRLCLVTQCEISGHCAWFRLSLWGFPQVVHRCCTAVRGGTAADICICLLTCHVWPGTCVRACAPVRACVRLFPSPRRGRGRVRGYLFGR